MKGWRCPFSRVKTFLFFLLEAPQLVQLSVSCFVLLFRGIHQGRPDERAEVS